MPKRLPYEMMTKKEYMKVHRDFRGTLKTPRIVKLDDDPESPSYLGTISKPVKFIDESGNLLVDLKSKMPKWKEGRGYTSKKEMEIKLSKYNPFASGRRDVFTKDEILKFYPAKDLKKFTKLPVKAGRKNLYLKPGVDAKKYRGYPDLSERRFAWISLTQAPLPEKTKVLVDEKPKSRGWRR